jgi:KDO2-lipid IV(A) lauroyltransferase
MKILQPVVSELLYLTIISFIFLVRITPRPIAITVGRLLGLAFWALVPYYRKLVKIQMKNALGSGYSRLLPIKAFMNFGIIPVEIIKFSYLNEAEIKKRLLVEGMENVESALADGRAIMCVTGHISNWEILANVAIFIGSKLHIVMAIQRDPKLESIFKSIRARLHGVEVLPPKGGMVSSLIETLKQGKHIGMMVDQRHQKKYGLICDLLGMPAITTPAPAFIALKGDAIILPVSSSKGQGKTYRVRFEKPIDPREFGTIDDNIEKLSDGAQTEAVQKISDSIQAWLTLVIRTYPDQWLWLHSRWVRRKYMKKIFKEDLDFRKFVFKQAEGIKQEFKSKG